MTDDAKTQIKRVTEYPDGKVITEKEYAIDDFADIVADKDSHKMNNPLSKISEYPNTTNLTALAGVIALITWNPGILPYALADEVLDPEEIKAAIIEIVVDVNRVSTLQSDIRAETINIQDLDAQILSGLCIPSMPRAGAPAETCVLEKVFKGQAESRKDSYQAELNNIQD